MKSLAEPSGIAIIGASRNFSTINGKILKYLLKHGYQGKIYPVNPKYEEIAGLTCYPSVSAIPDLVDLALVAIAAPRVPLILRECGSKGVRGVIIFSSGFAETGQEGRKIQTEITGIAKEFGMRILGPNCLGMLNVPLGLTAAFSASLEVETIKPGSVALVSQSGAVGFMLFNLLQEAGIGVNLVVTTGNEADLTAGEALSYVVEDSTTKVVLTYLEGLRDGKSFSLTAQKAAESGKPIIALKVGNSASGQKAAATHTAALTGSAAAYNSYFQKLGIIEAFDSDEVVDFAQAFVPGKLPEGSKVGIVTMSGGVGILLADRCEEAGLKVPELTPVMQDRLNKVIPSFGSAQNPVDITAQSLNQGDEFKKCLKILLESDEIDMLIVAITMATGQLAEKIGQDIAQCALESDKPLVVSWSVGQIAESGFNVLREAGVPLYHSPARAAKALTMLNSYAAFTKEWEAPRPVEVNESRRAKVHEMLKAGSRTLTERDTKKILDLYDLPVTKEYLATNSQEAVAKAVQIGYPVVMKIDSPEILHKTEAGGVAVDVCSASQVEAKFAEIVTSARVYDPTAQINGVLVQEQVPPGLEAIVGLQCDPVLGPQIMFGLGGIFVEVFKDVVLRPVPLSRDEAARMLDGIKGTPLLCGVRGRPPVDTEALIAVLMGISQLAVEVGEDILSLDLNPVTVMEQGKGAKILDGVIVRA